MPAVRHGGAGVDDALGAVDGVDEGTPGDVDAPAEASVDGDAGAAGDDGSAATDGPDVVPGWPTGPAVDDQTPSATTVTSTTAARPPAPTRRMPEG